MAVSTFAELKTAITAEIDRTDVSEAQVANWISFFEANFNRDGQFRSQETEAPLSATSETVDLPTDYKEAVAVTLSTDPAVVLETKTVSDLISTYPTSTTGQPVAFAVLGSKMYLRPLPDTTYNIRLFYRQNLPALSDTQTTNWLLTSHPDVYVYGTLVWSAPYFQDDARLSTWLGLYDRAIASLKGQDARARFSGQPIKTQLDVVVA